MDQKIIAQEEGISVSTVSRMLKKAEEMGYIKIRLFNIFRKSYPEFLSPKGSFTSVYISLLYYSSKKKLWEKFKR